MKLTHRQAHTLIKIVDDAILKATEIMAEWANGYIEKCVWVEEPKADTEG